MSGAYTDTVARAESFRYVPALDGVRALAVLMVVGVHTQVILLAPRFQLAPGAFLGVDLFFVLSGFLITRLLLDERRTSGRVRLGHFYIRRAARLLPALAVLLVVHAIWAQNAGVPMSVEWRSIGFVALYLGNWIFWFPNGYLADGIGHLWSLGIEEQFYLLWPALVLALTRRRWRPAVIAIALGCTWALLVRSLLWNQGEMFVRLFTRTDLRLEPLLIGSLLGLAHARGIHQAWSPRLKAALGWLGCAVLALAALTMETTDPSALMYGGYTVVALAGAGVVSAALVGGSGLARLLSLRPLVVVGKVSYGLYLWHLPVMVAVQWRFENRSNAVRVLLSGVLIVLATSLSRVAVEVPILKLARRRVGRTGAVESPSAAPLSDLTP